jgi:hypothetical protein
MWKYFFNGAVLLVLSAGKVHADARASNSNNSITFGARRAIPTQKFKKVIYAANYGVICDGITVNSTSVTNAIAAGGQNAHVIFPPGTCLVSVESGTFNVYDGSRYSGAGKFATTIKRANGGSANNSIFTIASGGAFGATGNVMFSDFTIDGNYTNETGGGDGITGTIPISKFTAMRMRFVNNWSDGIAVRLVGVIGGTGNSSDVLITDNDFESNGLRAACAGINFCQDVMVSAPLRVRVTRNRSDNSQNGYTFSGHNGAGFLTVSENIITSCSGFAVALGGSGTNPGPAGISGNHFNCPSSNMNIVDLALWSDIRVANNTITMGGASNTGGIADAPPANKVQVIGNRVTGNGTGAAACIILGGSDLLVKANYCNGSGGPGIDIVAGLSTQVKNIVIRGNTIKNTGARQSGEVGAIEFYLTPGTASMTGVVIKGNRLFDDQGMQTQGYGVSIARVGQTTGYSNFTIENNDLRGNRTAAILNKTSGATGMLIANNPGGEAFYVCQRTTCPPRRPSAPAPQRQTPQP